MVDNLFMEFNLGDSPQLLGNFSKTTGCYIAHQGGATTQATKALSLNSSATFSFDFSAELLFPTIESVSYSVVTDGALASLPSHAARPPVGRTVAVEFAAEVSATVHMTVRQCL